MERLLAGAYNPAETFEQLLQCTLRQLTQEMLPRLTADQISTFQRAIAVYADTLPSLQARRREAPERQRVRDSTIRSVLLTRVDSAQFAKNVHSRQQWWAAGNCNGKPVPRRW